LAATDDNALDPRIHYSFALNLGYVYPSCHTHTVQVAVGQGQSYIMEKVDVVVELCEFVEDDQGSSIWWYCLGILRGFELN
jgi:hypothetical protein